VAVTPGFKMITKGMNLPTEEELTVEEVNVSFPYLRAASFHLGKYCESVNNEFMLCKDETNDPRKCVDAGKGVTACTLEFLRKVKANCLHEFNDYTRCLDYTSPDCRFEECRKTQAVFDSCILDKLGQKRVPFGYFTEIRIHESSRPKPPPEPPIVIKDPLPELPSPDIERKPGRHGSRMFGIY